MWAKLMLIMAVLILAAGCVHPYHRGYYGPSGYYAPPVVYESRHHDGGRYRDNYRGRDWDRHRGHDRDHYRGHDRDYRHYR